MKINKQSPYVHNWAIAKRTAPSTPGAYTHTRPSEACDPIAGRQIKNTKSKRVGFLNSSKLIEILQSSGTSIYG